MGTPPNKRICLPKFTWPWVARLRAPIPTLLHSVNRTLSAVRHLLRPPFPSIQTHPARNLKVTVLTPRSRLTHEVRLLLESPSREMKYGGGGQTAAGSHSQTDIARRKPHALPPSSSIWWEQTQTDAVVIEFQRPWGLVEPCQQLLQHSPSGALCLLQP